MSIINWSWKEREEPKFQGEGKYHITGVTGKITFEKLKSTGAYIKEATVFRDVWPDGVDVTPENCVKAFVELEFGLAWATVNLLDLTRFLIYDVAERSIQKKFRASFSEAEQSCISSRIDAALSDLDAGKKPDYRGIKVRCKAIEVKAITLAIEQSQTAKALAFCRAYNYKPNEKE